MGTRDRILDAAAELLRTRGVANATTKQIAKAAGLSEAGLYKYFGDKEELLLGVLRERVPGVSELHVTPGAGELESNLAELAHGLLDFYRRAFPMLGSLLADPQRMAAHRESMGRHGGGPANPGRWAAEYLRAEQRLGRVPAGADPDSAAALLVGACFQQAFLRYYAEGPDALPAPRAQADALARTLLRGLGTGSSR